MAKVWDPKDNCRFAKYTLWEMNDYRKYNPDIIHWNNGIWDLFRKDFSDDVFTPKQEYLKYIEMVLNDLNALLKDDIEYLTMPDCFHLNDKGVEICAERIAEVLDGLIGK